MPMTRKRASDETQGLEDSEEEIDNSNSSNSKRSRVQRDKDKTKKVVQGGADSSDDADNDDDSSTDTDFEEEPAPKVTRTKRTSDESSKNARQSTNKKQRLSSSRISRARKNINDGPVSASFEMCRPGIIKRLRLYNFMCHKSFIQDWHNNINFITGENGSGKSALLSGILIGLGAKAALTSRTRSIKSLIKTGETYAKIEVTLLNNHYGLDEDKYGSEFTIQRILDSKGTSQYKIQTFGQWKPMKKNELERILVCLNIHLDNPIVVLNQETARNFLRTHDPKDKYKLYYEGLGLEKCEALLNNAKENIAIGFKNLEFNARILLEQKKEIDDLETKLQRIRQMDKVRDKIGRLNREYLWSLVIQEENKLAKIIQSYDVKKVNHEKILSKIKEAAEKIKELEEQERSPEASKAAAKGRLRTMEQEMSRLNKELFESRTKIHQEKLKLKDVNANIVKKKRSIIELEKKIKEMQENQEKESEERKTEIEEKRAILQSELTSCKQHFSTLKNDIEHFKTGSANKNLEIQQVESKMGNIKIIIERKKREVEMTKKKVFNPVTIYGKEYEELLELINANKSRFKHLPKGPIGSFITVKDKKWAVLIEYILRDLIHKFVVDNGQDASVFLELTNKVFNNQMNRSSYSSYQTRSKKPAVIVSKFQDTVYDISRGKANHETHPTIFDMLEFLNNDAVITNTLINMANIEKILLFSHREEGMILADPAKFPRTCRFGYSLDYFKIFPYPGLKFQTLQEPADKSSPKYIQISCKDRLKTIKIEIMQYTKELQELEPILKTKKNDEQQLKEEVQSRNEQVDEAKRKIKKAQEQLLMLQREESDTGPDIASFIEDLNDYQRNLKTDENKKAKFVDFLERTEPICKEKEERKHALEGDIDNAQQEIQNIDESSEKNKQKMLKFIDLSRRVKTQAHDISEEMKELEGKILAANSEKDDKLKKVSGDRIETRRDPDQIIRQFKDEKLKLAEAEKQTGSLEEVTKKMNAIKPEYNLKINKQTTLEKLLKAVASCHRLQSDYFKNSRTDINISLSNVFQALIAQRGYQGIMDINSNTKELYCFICPDDPKMAQMFKKSKDAATASGNDKRKTWVDYSLQLSGGEKSLSTICFIISMWQLMGCPFYMLDEFDVFMDSMNRKMCQSALLCNAKNHKDNQYFLFTPLELTEYPSRDEACILRMYPPERNPNENEQPAGSSSNKKTQSQVAKNTQASPVKAIMAKGNNTTKARSQQIRRVI